MYIKIILNILLIMALAVVQLSFVSGLPGWLKFLNLILIALVFVLAVADLKLALWWGLGAGLLLDIFSFQPFGIYMVCLGLTLLAANFLSKNFFTDRSLYSFFALIFFSSFIFEFFFIFLNYLAQPSGGGEVAFLNYNFWSSFLKQTIVNLAAVAVIFYALNFISKRLRPVFLVRQRKL